MSDNVYSFFINSRINRRTNELDGGTFTVYFNDSAPITAKKIYLSIDSIELPNSMYTFPYYESVIYYRVGNDPERTIELSTERVYYTPNELLTDLNSQVVGGVIRFTFDDKTNKLSITGGIPNNVFIAASYRYGTTQPNNAADKLGFTQPPNQLVIGPGGSITAASPVRMHRSNCYYLTCKEIISTSSIPQNWTISPILAKISCSSYGLLSQFLYPNTIKVRLNESRLQKLTFELLDDLYLPVELPINHPMTFCIRVELQ